MEAETTSKGLSDVINNYPSTYILALDSTLIWKIVNYVQEKRVWIRSVLFR